MPKIFAQVYNTCDIIITEIKGGAFMNKKSKVVSILNTVFSSIGLFVFGYLSFVMWVIVSIAFDLGNGENLISLLFSFILTILPLILCITNLVLSCISYKYIGKGIDKYLNGKKFMKAFIIIELISFIIFIIGLIMNISSILLVLLHGSYALIYFICFIIHIKDYKLIKNVQRVENV